MGGKLVDASIELHRAVMNNFLPSAVKFHYQFNLREMSNMVQGLCRMIKEYFKQPVQVQGLGNLHILPCINLVATAKDQSPKSNTRPHNLPCLCFLALPLLAQPMQLAHWLSCMCLQVARLWVHETERVFRDRMVNEADMQKFDEFRFAVTKKCVTPSGGFPGAVCACGQTSAAWACLHPGK